MSEHIIETRVCAGFPFVPIGGTDKLREEIVRCRDCKHFYANRVFNQYECMRDDELYIRPKVDHYGFCAWGERRDG